MADYILKLFDRELIRFSACDTGETPDVNILRMEQDALPLLPPGITLSIPVFIKRHVPGAAMISPRFTPRYPILFLLSMLPLSIRKHRLAQRIFRDIQDSVRLLRLLTRLRARALML